MGLKSGSSLCWGQAEGDEGWQGRYMAGPSIPQEQCCWWQLCNRESSWEQKCPWLLCPPPLCGIILVVGQALNQRWQLVSCSQSLQHHPSPSSWLSPLWGANMARGIKFTAHSLAAKDLPPWVLFLPICSPCSLSHLLLPVKCMLSVSDCARHGIWFPKWF